MINKVLQGDCLELMRDIPDNYIDLTVTSPPYDNLRTYNGSLEWGEHIWQPILKELYRITKQGGVVVWVVGDATIKGSETGTSFKQALWAKECGFNLHDTMIYEKKSCYAHDPRNMRYKAIFEYMFIFSKGKPNTYNEIKDKPNLNVGKTYKGGKGRNKNGVLRKSKEFVISEFQARTNIWRIPTDHRSEHPAIFPVKLAQDHIISWSNEGDLVLDCFAGSGTTAIACINTNRNYILIEKEQKYYDIIQDRINKHTNQINLF